jgi:hypothetical protein
MVQQQSEQQSEQPQQQQQQTIIIDDKPTVSFGEYDAVFDSDNPQQSDMIYDPKDGDENDVPALEILDDQGTSLAEGIDFDDLGNKEAIPEDLATDDYESLS